MMRGGFRRLFVAFWIGVPMPAFASGDPIIVVYFGLGALVGLGVFGLILKDWKHHRAHWSVILVYVIAMSGIWYLCWTSTRVGNTVSGASLIGIPILFAFICKVLAGRQRKHPGKA
jgi:hypothetical protein